MRLGLIGPALCDDEALENAARFLLEDIRVERAVYLDVDGALDRVVRKWAERLVGESPDDREVWVRAARRCLQASPEQIHEFLRAERERMTLRSLESLPDRGTCTVELLGGKIAVLVHDKSVLTEEDLLPASMLVFGLGREPLVKQVGSRWFLSPGPLKDHGIMALEELEEGVQLSLYERGGKLVRSEVLSTQRMATIRISGSTAR
jgi:hypothetical protein